MNGNNNIGNHTGNHINQLSINNNSNNNINTNDDNTSTSSAYRRRFNRDNNTAALKDAIKLGPNKSSDLDHNQERDRTRDQELHDRQGSIDVLDDGDDIMSILMSNQDKGSDKENRHFNDAGDKERALKGLDMSELEHNRDESALELIGKRRSGMSIEDQLGSLEREEDRDGKTNTKNSKGSFEEEPNMDLLRQYVAVDYEITQLEDKDALRVYHEKIEQLEQLERELDMISTEAEEVAVRSETGSHLERLQSLSVPGTPQTNQKLDAVENNSVTSDATGTISTQKSWINNPSMNSNINSNKNSQSQQQHTGSKRMLVGDSAHKTTSQLSGRNRFNNNPSYSTVEEVFNRKIILEKERDKLKKEVDFVIVECDRLQQRYKKRDEILDRLFDGRTGNGLENHLEQQLNWLLEQKHYVDQVFYAWKRAETLTSQTCEQFASALDLLKKLPKIDELGEKEELAKSIGSLLAKSRQDMEQAQKYNPNVDAPFFTDNETERFDKIIETISSNSLSPSEYSQILTVIQFAYKRAVSIRLWLEQILQTTIARDSFELAEEYKWIAIQLRKERINLIKSKLQDLPYQQMVQQIQEQMARQQSQYNERRQQNEINRDSGVESETNDIDIEEEIYRLLELNKSRLETATAIGNIGNNGNVDLSNQHRSLVNNRQLIISQTQNGPFMGHGGSNLSSSSEFQQQQQQRDETMRHRIQRRVKGDQPLHLTRQIQSPIGARVPPPDGFAATGTASNSAATGKSTSTSTKLKIELDEEARQNLLSKYWSGFFFTQVEVEKDARLSKM